MVISRFRLPESSFHYCWSQNNNEHTGHVTQGQGQGNTFIVMCYEHIQLYLEVKVGGANIKA